MNRPTTGGELHDLHHNTRDPPAATQELLLNDPILRDPWLDQKGRASSGHKPPPGPSSRQPFGFWSVPENRRLLPQSRILRAAPPDQRLLTSCEGIADIT